MNTVNLEIDIPEGEILHERLEPYEVVIYVIGEDASTMTEATLTLMTNSIARIQQCIGKTETSSTPNDPKTTLNSTQVHGQRNQMEF